MYSTIQTENGPANDAGKKQLCLLSEQTPHPTQVECGSATILQSV